MKPDEKRSVAKKEKGNERERWTGNSIKEFAQLPRMTEDEDIELYISSFEKRLLSVAIPQDRWVDNLRPLMSNWATQVVEVMDQKDEKNYQMVKDILLQAFASSKGPLSLRAMVPQWKKGQTVAQFVAQQQRLIRQWLQDSTITEVAAKITMVQTEQALPYACRTYLHSCKPKTPTEMVTEVEHFFATRGLSWNDMGNNSNNKTFAKGQRWQHSKHGYSQLSSSQETFSGAKSEEKCQTACTV